MTLPSGKGPDAFRTISEASAELGVPQHVLRFWETKFAFIRPMKRAGGRRFYRPQDLDVLRGVKALLHHEGYTIKGVQRLHREQGLKRLVAAGLGGPGAEAPAAERDAPTGAEGTPRAHQRSTAGDDAEEEEDGPQTGDLFETAAPSIRFPPAPATSSAPTPPARVEPTEIDPADLLAAAALPVEPPTERPSRHVLDPRARTRLAEVLDDLERTKDAIDALIGA